MNEPGTTEDLLVEVSRYLQELEQQTRENLAQLLENDNYGISSDPAVVKMRSVEKDLSDRYSSLATQRQLVGNLIASSQGLAGSLSPIRVPVVFDQYVKTQRKLPSYKGNPGLLVQDMYIGYGEEDLDPDLIDYLDDNPNDAINAIMNGGYIVEDQSKED